MTAPIVRHADWCRDPTLRRSDLILDRRHIRWRCAECGAQTITTKETPK